VIIELLDFTRIKLAKLSLHYVDEANGIDSRKDMVIKKTDTSLPVWSVRLQDRSKKNYQWEVTYFMTDGTQRHLNPATTNDTALVLEVPA
jgi:hypothetical protein